MDFNDTPEEAAFRAKARAWLAEHAPDFRPPPTLGDAEGFAQMPLSRAWQARKAEARYARITWPLEYGGRGGTPIEDFIFEEEERRHALPPYPFGISLGMCIPTLIQWGTAEAKAQFVPAALRGDTLWCQLFSEPSAGSDLANVRTRAVRDGDDWLVSGQKVWTTGAHLADYGTILARSDPTAEKYRGLSYFYFDMRSPGVEVRPIRQASGHSGFNEVFLSDVRIPDAQRLGEEGEGWKVAISTLLNERMVVNETDFGTINIDDLVALACDTGFPSGRPIDQPENAARIADAYVRAAGARYIRYRMLTALSRGEMPGPEAAIGKLVVASNLQSMARLAMDFYGAGGIIADPTQDPLLARIQDAWFYAAGGRIAGGTDEILRNTLAERVLGLPQDARVDRNIPFNQLPN
jgi:alkylation response protein AidB-like acyl-CoA dehydrogenase